ncbi:MAG: enoyl-CoA hydratase/isomerase family protein [Bacteroidota bacterium]
MTSLGKLTNELSINGVRTLTFSHPAHNSVPGDLLITLIEALVTAGQDQQTHSILLRTTGEHTFCAGANLDELLAVTNTAEAKAFFMAFANLILAMRQCPKPIIVAVQGKAIGGGIGIAAAADYCLATEAASIKFSELAITIGPFVILPALARKIGAAATAELTLDTEWHSARWAQTQGLFQRLYPTPTELYSAANELATKLCRYSPAAMAGLKQTLWAGTDHWPVLLEERAAAAGNLVFTKEARLALDAFKKR